MFELRFSELFRCFVFFFSPLLVPTAQVRTLAVQFDISLDFWLTMYGKLINRKGGGGVISTLLSGGNLWVCITFLFRPTENTAKDPNTLSF